MSSIAFPAPLSVTDLENAPAIEWLWYGYLAPGNVTLLTSQWKTGKTTLVSVLLHHLKTGGSLAGLPLRPGSALVLSEESPALWLDRSRRFNYAGHVHWFCRPFHAKPTPAQWTAFLAHILAIHRQGRIDLFVIDPLASFLPGRDENNASLMMEFLTPLQALTAAGLAVLILHHPRKEPTVDGRSPRGSGALPGFADILIEMHHPAPSQPTRRRHLLAWSRHTQTPPAVVLELNANATNYINLGTPPDVAAAAHQDTLDALLATAPNKLTRLEILDLWPTTPRPAPNTLWLWLEKGVADGRIRRAGLGHKTDPFRYWSPVAEAEWKKDPITRLKLEQEETFRNIVASLSEYPPQV
jgi:hypothetical protein